MNLSSTARQMVFWLLIIAGALLLYKLSYIWPMLIAWAPLLFIIAIWIFMLRHGIQVVVTGRKRL